MPSANYGYLRKINAMNFYQKFDVESFVNALKVGDIGNNNEMIN
jgi:hypothetical protein